MTKSLTIEDAMIEAESSAWKALARYKFLLFYYSAQWVLLNRLHNKKTANPFSTLVKLARKELEPKTNNIK